MTNYYWNDWYTGWGWLLWYGIFVLFFSSVGNWGYSYRTHRRFSDLYGRQSALDILNVRYARGEITHDEFLNMKSNIDAQDPKSIQTDNDHSQLDLNEKSATTVLA